jgi:hypothetical protein
MNTNRNVRLVVVAGEVGSRALVDGLQRLGLAHVRCVTDIAAARSCCETGDADICLVVLPCFLLEERAEAVLAAEAPGRVSGIPSLLVADAATPYLRKAARRAGHAGVIAQDIAPRLMYRRIAAVLQRSRRTARAAAQQIRLATVVGSRSSGSILLRGLPRFAPTPDPRKLRLHKLQ